MSCLRKWPISECLLFPLHLFFSLCFLTYKQPNMLQLHPFPPKSWQTNHSQQTHDCCRWLGLIAIQPVFFSGLAVLLQAEPLQNCSSKKTFYDAVYPEHAPHSCSLVTDTNSHITTAAQGRIVLIILNYWCKTWKTLDSQRILGTCTSHLNQVDDVVSTYLCRSADEGLFVRSCWTAQSSSNWKWCFPGPEPAPLLVLSESRELSSLHQEELLCIQDRSQFPSFWGNQVPRFACQCLCTNTTPPCPIFGVAQSLSQPANFSLNSYFGLYFIKFPPPGLI